MLICSCSPFLPPAKITDLHSLFIDLPFLDISYKWRDIIHGLCDNLLSVSMFSIFIHVVECISTLFLLIATYSIAWLYDICLFIHQLLDIWLSFFFFFTFWLFWKMLLWAVTQKPLCGCVLPRNATVGSYGNYKWWFLYLS